MARFVVQHHTHPSRPTGDHFDLMLEHGRALLTWQIAEPPDGPEHRAQRIADHRIAYLTYEGEVRGGRGAVRIWDRGELTIEELAETHLLFSAEGESLYGRYALLREGESWTLTKRVE